MLGECRRKILIYQCQLSIIDIIHLAFFKSNDFQYGTRSLLASPTESLSQDSAGAGNCLVLPGTAMRIEVVSWFL